MWRISNTLAWGGVWGGDQLKATISTTMNIFAATALLALVATHLIGDFFLQGDDDVAAKRRLHVRAYLSHGVKQAVVAYCFAGVWFVWQIPALVFASHVLIDGLKEALLRWLAPRDKDDKPVTRWKFWAIIFDQILHLAALAAIVEFLDRYGLISIASQWSDLLGVSLWLKALTVLSGAVLTIFAGGVLIGILVQPLLQEMRGASPPAIIRVDQRGLEKGGRLIGQLERCLILLFILSGQPAGVGFLVAAKSILRFGELKDHKYRMEAEYIIIGTMLSFIWALATAWLTQWALATIG